MKKIHFDTIDSTNLFLKEHHRELVDFFVVSADRQTQGRGRLGRTWEDDGQSALFSILVKTHLVADTLDHMPLIAAAAVHKTLVNYLPGVQIKWPNDIVFSGKKLAGILAESILEDRVPQALIIGIGLNVNQRDFGLELQESASSLFRETGREHLISRLVDEMAAAFEVEYHAFESGTGDAIGYCNQYSSLVGKPIVFYQNGKSLTGVAGWMAPDGSLQVRTPQGLRHLHSGEVTLSQIHG